MDIPLTDNYDDSRGVDSVFYVVELGRHDALAFRFCSDVDELQVGQVISCPIYRKCEVISTAGQQQVVTFCRVPNFQWIGAS
jgi:hypothetical protein